MQFWDRVRVVRVMHRIPWLSVLGKSLTSLRNCYGKPLLAELFVRAKSLPLGHLPGQIPPPIHPRLDLRSRTNPSPLGARLGQIPPRLGKPLLLAGRPSSTNPSSSRTNPSSLGARLAQIPPRLEQIPPR
jgi:hypothetical protein